MQKFIICVFISITFFGCKLKGPSSVESDHLLKNLLDNNEIAIARIKAHMLAQHIEKREKNVKLASSLEALHQRTVNLIDSVDRIEKKTVIEIINQFVRGNFAVDNINYVRSLPFDVNTRTPNDIVKLYLAIAENNYLISEDYWNYDYPEPIRLKDF